MGSLWNRSGMVERYADDLRASGAKAYFFDGGTTTPLTVYQDSGESAAHTHPVVADANGRWPDVFVPYTLSFDVRVTSADDVQLTYSIQIPNPDPIELSVTIPAEEKVQTGMIHPELIDATKSGYVRLNGRTMGNGASGATERANADTSALFTYLWNNLTDAIAPVSGGRGGSAAADFAANKTIVLPSTQGAALLGLDDMGAAAGNFFSGLVFSVGDAVTPGSRTGTNGLALTADNLPAHIHSGTTAAEGAHSHTGTTEATTSTGSLDSQGAHTHTVSGTTSSNGSHTHTIPLGNNQLGGSARAPQGGTTVQGNSDTTTSDGAHTHTFSATTSSDGSHTHTITMNSHTHTFTTSLVSDHSHTFTTDSVGASAPFNNLPRSLLVTWFIKL